MLSKGVEIESVEEQSKINLDPLYLQRILRRVFENPVIFLNRVNISMKNKGNDVFQLTIGIRDDDIKKSYNIDLIVSNASVNIDAFEELLVTKRI